MTMFHDGEISLTNDVCVREKEGHGEVHRYDMVSTDVSVSAGGLRMRHPMLGNERWIYWLGWVVLHMLALFG